MSRPPSVPHMATRLSGCAVLAALLASVGCGPGVSTVSGSVLSGKSGKKVPIGTVVLIASDKSSHSSPIGEDGTYSIANVPVGLAMIGVSSPNPSAAPAGERAGGMKKPPRDGGAAAPPPAAPTVSEAVKKAWFPISEKLSDPLSSKLTVEVVPKATPHDIKVD